jgi:hypothetical protein
VLTRPGHRLAFVSTVRPWPKIPDEDRWLIELMEERFEKTDLPPEQLRARANELRAQAERGQAGGDRDAALALADRYEQAAAARVARR